MALMRAEITKVRESRPTPSPIPATNEQEQKKAEQETAALRDQMALMSAEISKLRENRPAAGVNSVHNAQEQKKVEKETAAAREQLVMLNAEISKLQLSSGTPRVASAVDTAAWKERIAKVEEARGKLTLASAIAKLLGTPSATDLARIEAFETQVRRRAYSSALAVGVDASGLLVWGGSYGQSQQSSAGEIALDFCAGAGGSKCKALIVNGAFLEQAWFEVVKQLGAQPIEAVRTAFMTTLEQPILENQAGVGGSAASHNRMYGYTFSRSAAK